MTSSDGPEIENVRIVFLTFSISALPPGAAFQLDFTFLIYGPLFKKGDQMISRICRNLTLYCLNHATDNRQTPRRFPDIFFSICVYLYSLDQNYV